MNGRVVIVCSYLLAAPAFAQAVRDVVTPAVGTAAVASVGEPVYKKEHYSALIAYEVQEGFSGKNIMATVVISPGDKFMPVTSKSRMKACRSPSMEAFKQGVYDACLYDDDGDGKFDRFGANEIQGGKKLPHPIAYTLSEYVEPARDAVKQVVTFLGSTKDTLPLSYREFVNDLARPAFTEEYTFPLAATYPQPIAFKGVHVTVTGIDGLGMHYTLEASPPLVMLRIRPKT